MYFTKGNIGFFRAPWQKLFGNLLHRTTISEKEFLKPWSKLKTETQKYYSKVAVFLLGLTITGFEIYILRKLILFSLYIQDSYTLILWPWLTVRLLNLDFFSSYSTPDLMGTKNEKLDNIQFFFHNWIVIYGKMLEVTNDITWTFVYVLSILKISQAFYFP
jgi:hypothetical protein